MEGLATAVLVGYERGADRLLRSSDRAELVVESMLTNLVAERRERLREAEINQMANAIAERFP